MKETWNYADPIDEIYAIRRKISERYGNDVRRIAAAAALRMDEIRRAGRVVISSPEELSKLYVQMV